MTPLAKLAVAIAGYLLAGMPAPLQAGEPRERCRDDAILVFDASGSMAGTDMNSVAPHIAKVRRALASVMPSISPVRNLGLVTYGPGPWSRCDNVELNVAPGPDAGPRILGVVNSLAPAGDTPLTRSVELAAEALSYRDEPATVVLFTDGEETCGGDPCALAKRLKATAKDITVHVIGFRTPVSVTLGMGLLATRCLADTTGGTVATVETEDEIRRALSETLGCPLTTELARPQTSGTPSLE